MPHSDLLRLRDIEQAISRIQDYAASNSDWSEGEGLVWDAILYNFAVIGEAVKALSEETRALAPEAAWGPAAKMRDFVIHQYSATDPAVVASTIEGDLPPLASVANQLIAQLESQ